MQQHNLQTHYAGHDDKQLDFGILEHSHHSSKQAVSSGEEAYHRVEEITGKSEAEIEFNLLDINGDGVLTKDEYIRQETGKDLWRYATATSFSSAH